jgi:NAD-dependent dihydropyrimidine dehydrogenase PreA subunit
MSEFIRVEINMNNCIGISECGQCVRVCPVNIFDEEDVHLFIVEQSQDECILCELCLEVCTPKAIIIRKLYD